MGYECRNGSVSQKIKIFGQRSYWWNVVYCIGVWEVTFNFWFLKIFTWFLGGAKVWVKKSFCIENLKMDIGQFFWLLCGHWCETMLKSSILSILFHLDVCWMSFQVVDIEIYCKNFDKKWLKSENRNQSNWNQSNRKKSNRNQITASSMELFFSSGFRHSPTCFICLRLPFSYVTNVARIIVQRGCPEWASAQHKFFLRYWMMMSEILYKNK